MINKQSVNNITKMEKLISSNLFVSDFYEIKHRAYDFMEETKTRKRYNDCLCVVFVKKGNFLFDLSRDSYDMHSGHIVMINPTMNTSSAHHWENAHIQFYRRILPAICG